MSAARARRRLPPLLASRPLVAQVGLAVAAPIVFGAVCGLALGWSGLAYLVLSVLAALGGVGAGFEHDRVRSGLLRGVCGGTLFGAALLIAHALSGAAAMAHLPSPRIVLVVVTAGVGAALGALGAQLRSRRADAAGTASAS